MPTRISGASPFLERLSFDESGMDWSPERQILIHQSRVYLHRGATLTPPSHDIAHLLVGTCTGSRWIPRGELDEIKLAEFSAIVIEHLLARIYGSTLGSSSTTEEITAQTRTHGRWFVERHYAPFPLSYQEAEQRFISSLDIESLTRLCPLFFEQKHKERESGFMTQNWILSFRSAEIPLETMSWRFLQPAVRSCARALAP